MAWLFVPGLADLSSDSELPSETMTALTATALFAMSSGIATPRPHSWRGWKTRPWSQRLFGTISRPLTAQRGVDAWISSLPVFHASRGAPPEHDEASTTSDGSGQTLRGSFATWLPEPSSWRTSQVSFLEDLNTFSGTWPRSGSMRSGACSERPMLALRTSVSESGYWPTPDANAINDGESVESWTRRRARVKEALGNGNGMGTPLAMAAKTWPTESATDAEKQRDSASQLKRHTPGLEALATMWPTPRAEDAESAGNHPGAQDSLTGTVKLWPTPTGMDANSSGGSSSYPTNTKSHSGTTLTDAGVRQRASETMMRGNPTLLGQALWQTPKDHSAGGNKRRGGDRSDELLLMGQAVEVSGHQHPTTCSHGAECRRVLNPPFVETLMAWPTGWSDFGSRVTGLSLFVQRWRTYIFERGYWRE